MEDLNFFNFSDYKGNNVVMHCETEYEAMCFTYILSSNGRKWCSGDSYEEKSEWSACKDSSIDGICYQFNIGRFCRLKYAKMQSNYLILRFSDFNFMELEESDFSAPSDLEIHKLLFE